MCFFQKKAIWVLTEQGGHANISFRAKLHDSHAEATIALY